MENTTTFRLGVSSPQIRKVTYFFLICIGFWLPVILDAKTIQTVALLPLPSSSNLYFLPQFAGLLCLKAPVVILSALVLLFSPGLIFTLALGKAKSVGQWLIYGLTTSIILISLVTAIFQAITGSPITGLNFSLLVVICAVVGFVFLYRQILYGVQIEFPDQLTHYPVTFDFDSIAIGDRLGPKILLGKFQW